MSSWGCRKTLLLALLVITCLKIESPCNPRPEELSGLGKCCLTSPAQGGKDGRGKHLSGLAGHKRCRELEWGAEHGGELLVALQGPEGPVLVLALTIACQETLHSDGASFAATQHPMLPSWCALLPTKNLQGRLEKWWRKLQHCISEFSGSAF